MLLLANSSVEASAILFILSFNLLIIGIAKLSKKDEDTEESDKAKEQGRGLIIIGIGMMIVGFGVCSAALGQH